MHFKKSLRIGKIEERYKRESFKFEDDFSPFPDFETKTMKELEDRVF